MPLTSALNKVSTEGSTKSLHTYEIEKSDASGSKSTEMNYSASCQDTNSGNFNSILASNTDKRTVEHRQGGIYDLVRGNSSPARNNDEADIQDSYFITEEATAFQNQDTARNSESVLGKTTDIITPMVTNDETPTRSCAAVKPSITRNLFNVRSTLFSATTTPGGSTSMETTSKATTDVQEPSSGINEKDAAIPVEKSSTLDNVSAAGVAKQEDSGGGGVKMEDDDWQGMIFTQNCGGYDDEYGFGVDTNETATSTSKPK